MGRPEGRSTGTAYRLESARPGSSPLHVRPSASAREIVARRFTSTGWPSTNGPDMSMPPLWPASFMAGMSAPAWFIPTATMLPCGLTTATCSTPGRDAMWSRSSSTCVHSFSAFGSCRDCSTRASAWWATAACSTTRCVNCRAARTYCTRPITTTVTSSEENSSRENDRRGFFRDAEAGDGIRMVPHSSARGRRT